MLSARVWAGNRLVLFLLVEQIGPVDAFAVEHDERDPLETCYVVERVAFNQDQTCIATFFDQSDV